MTSQAILALIEAVDSTAGRIAAAALRSDVSTPNDVVRARRIIADQIRAMTQALEIMLAYPLMTLGSTEALSLRRAYVERNGRARAAVAAHQAQWAATEVRIAAASYRADVARLHEDQKAYRRWLKTEFVPKAAALLGVQGMAAAGR